MNAEQIANEALRLPLENREEFINQNCADNLDLKRVVYLHMEQASPGRQTAHQISPSPEPDTQIASPHSDARNRTTEHYENRQTEDVTNPSRLRKGTIIGARYLLIDQIGAGGMGSVWRAEQFEPVKRLVALKLIKPGMDSRTVLLRFEAERQALARMDHPHIARIFDGGMTESGHPYFIMELVKGVPITEYCDQNYLTIRERAELFMQVCSAVQHAHQKGIIHRDLKPSNILVSEVDGKPEVKVIDFGLAKALRGVDPLADFTRQTVIGAVLGTPLYMAPEQLEVDERDVDTRTDLYSLGVILYELLTGWTPIDRERIKEASWDELRRLIKEEEPPKPSTKNLSGAFLNSIAASRKIEPSKLRGLIRGDLDWITMKALEKDRNRRYETVNGLEMEIKRFLSGEPVLAAPPTRIYRIKKFVRRHRGPVIAASLITISLIVGMAGTSYGFYRADSNWKLAMSEKDRAVERERDAIDAISVFAEVVILNSELKNSSELDGLRKTLLKTPLRYFQTLKERLQAETNPTPESLTRLGAAAFQYAHLTEQIGDVQDALRIYKESRELIESMVNLENREILLGSIDNNVGCLLVITRNYEESSRVLTEALRVRERLAKEHPDSLDRQIELMSILNNIGNTERLTNRIEQAMDYYGQATQLGERLLQLNPSDSEIKRGLSAAYLGIGNLSEYRGNIKDSQEAIRTSGLLLDQLLKDQPLNPEFQNSKGMIHRSLGGLYRKMSQPEEALLEFQLGLKYSESLVLAYPSMTDYQAESAAFHNAIGLIHREQKRFREAITSYEKAKTIYDQLIKENPTVGSYQKELSRTYYNIGFVYNDRGEYQNALIAHEKAKAIRELLVKSETPTADALNDLASSHNHIGIIQMALGKFEDSEKSFLDALKLREQLATDHPEMIEYRSNLGATFSNLALRDLDTKKNQQARERILLAIGHQQFAYDSNPSDPTYRQFLGNHYKILMWTAEELDDPLLASDARKGLAKIATRDPQAVEVENRLKATLAGDPPKNPEEPLALAQRAYDTGRYALAVKFYESAMAANPKLMESRDPQVAYNAACAAVLGGTGAGLEDQPIPEAMQTELRQKALAWLEAELVIWGRIINANPKPTLFTRLLGNPDPNSIRETLQHWKKDFDLSGVRGNSLEKLPSDEQSKWRALWEKVDTLLKELDKNEVDAPKSK